MALTFGTTDTTYGLSQSISTRSSVEIADGRAGDGAIDEQKAYSKTVERTESVLTTGALPTIGTVDATYGLVSQTTAGATNTGYATGEVTYTKKDSATQAAIA
jgi:hypothetical protein